MATTVNLPDELRSKILSQPLYRPEDVRQFLGNPPISALEQGRVGYGPLKNLRFVKMGKTVLYAAADLVAFIESLSTFANTTEVGSKR